MIDWVEDLRAEIASEFGGRPAAFAFASIDALGRPRVRSVVCRSIGDDGTIAFASDSRSAKNSQVRDRPEVEACLWLPGRRIQFRIAGTASIPPPDDDRRAAVWAGLSDSARALFSWPDPGGPRSFDPAAFPEKVGAEAGPPTNFEVVEVLPSEVDRLDLKGHPHRRTLRRRSTGWAEEPINP